MLVREDVEHALTYLENNHLIRLSRPVGNWYMVHCPFHGGGQEKKPSCGVSLVEDVRDGKVSPVGQWHCFACQASYPFGKGIKELLSERGTSLSEHPELEQYVNDSEDLQQKDSLIPNVTMTTLMTNYAVDNLKLRTLAKRNYISEEELAKYRYTVPYMFQRKLTMKVIEKYDIGYDANHIPEGRKKPLPCITFPVRDILGRTLFICRRSIEGKYFNLPQGIEKSLYGIYELPPNTSEVIVCESAFNALTAVVYGHPAVALFGTGTSYEIDQLKKLGAKSFVLCLDNDEAGRRGTEKLKKALSQSAIVWTMHVPDDGRDLNDLTYEEFIECYNNKD